MKLKLLFLILIVLFASCGKNTHKGADQMYYKKQMEEAQRLKDQEALTKKQTKGTTYPKYLTKEERIKYAELLNVTVDAIENENIYAKAKEWLNVTYLWGGTTKQGIDCSAFVQHIYKDVYDKDLPRTSQEQFDANLDVTFKSQKTLKHGDLLFFRLRNKDKVISHVGIYLQNGMFLGSNSPRGVEIANLNDEYWQDKYVSAARALLKK